MSMFYITIGVLAVVAIVVYLFIEYALPDMPERHDD